MLFQLTAELMAAETGLETGNAVPHPSSPEMVILLSATIALLILASCLICMLMMQRHRLRQAGQNLKTQVVFHQTLIDAVPIPIFYKDVQGTYLGCNRAFAHLLGVRKSAIVGKSVYDLAAPELAAIYAEKDLDILRSPGVQEYEAIIRDHDGNPRTVIFHKATFRGVDNEIFGIIGAVLDITARQQAEDQLRLQAQIIDQVPNAVIAHDLDGVVTSWNKGAERLYGYTAAEALGRHITFILPPELHASVHELIREPLEESGFHELEMPVRNKNGEQFFVLLSLTFLKDREGRTTGIIGYSLDITEHKLAVQALRESEEHYRLLFNSIYDFVFVHKLMTAQHPGRIIAVNDLTCQTFGYSREEFLRLPPQKLLAPESLDHVTGLMQRIVTEKNLSAEIVLRTRNGGRIPVELHASLIDLQEQPTVLTIARNITDRRQAAETQAKLEAQLLQGQKMQAIGTLAGGVAHDFNNILMAIIGYTVLGRDAVPADSKASQFLQEALKACDRAKNLVEQILTFSRPGTGERRPLIVKYLLKEALDMVRGTLPDNITIHADLATEAAVLGDSNQVYQVITNLCTNALQSMQDSGGVLEVTLREIDLEAADVAALPELRPGSHVLLTVRDTGSGIDPAVMGRIFEPYFTTRELGGGTGMGLAIVHGIVKEHGGAVTVTSSPREGTLFRIYFPRVAEQPLVTASSASIETDLPRGSEHLLLVDDEDVLAQVFEQLLTKLGYRVTACTDGNKALKIFQANPQDFDLVITDMTMPRMTGVKLARKLLRLRPNIPIILSSGYSDLISSADAQRVGIRDFLAKPISLENLAIKVRQVLDDRPSLTFKHHRRR